MDIVEQELATVEQADAYQSDDLLIVRLSGEKPTACHIVSIEQALTDVEPPAFAVRMRINPLARCMQQVADYEAVQAFRIGGPRPEVVIHHSGGDLRVAVTQLQVERRTSLDPSFPFPGGVFDEQPAEAFGYSRSYDPAEAIRDAIEKLPTRGADIPDWLNTYTVGAMVVEIGGIGGFNHLKVTVRG
ncbi:hypothetical protein [Ornithinimicrobium cryptoxanthini]|uniref:hypothetical protein n=1 Tax=Ornithinimicrobium cryptoxanthini TaxID=2934161 RepID=UPI0021184EC2|nr:hypothetical protein [Ornithinimicrobium cryptoxanthini]